MNKTIITLVCLAAVSFGLGAENRTEDWKTIDSRQVPAWFEDAKFGIFIHWGVYSVPSYSPSYRDGATLYDCYAEHYRRRLHEDTPTRHFFTDFHERVYGKDFRYEDFVKDFTAEMFNPDQWAEIIASSGAKYVVLTSKHHEGFCLWPSKYAWNWNAVDVGPHRDLLGDITKSVRAKGLKMGYYYSLLEWTNPIYKKETLEDYVTSHMIPQMKELVETYKPDILWPDGEWDYPSSKWHSAEFLRWLYSESSVAGTITVNDRWGKGCRGVHGGYYTTEYGEVDESVDKNTVRYNHPWEECRGIGGSFGFNRNELLQDYNTSEQLVHVLVNTVGRGGNLLLNIGPTADGRIPVIMQQRLKDIGDWLKVNGEAIYGTRKWSKAPAVGKDTKVYYTAKDDAVYVITTEWGKAPITVKGIKGAKKVTMLGTDAKVGFTKTADGISIRPLKISSPSDIPCPYAWVYKVVVNER